MELQHAFAAIAKRLEAFNTGIGFSAVKEQGVKADQLSIYQGDDGEYIEFAGKSGSYKIAVNTKTDILSLECSGDSGENAEYRNISKSLFEVGRVEERDIKSAVNELVEALEGLYSAKDDKDLDKIKLPKSVSKSAVRNGTVSYNDVDLATRFADTYGEFKNPAKEIIKKYGELLPETFFMEYGTPFVMEMLKSKDDEKLKKLFKMLNDIYDNGTNAAQDVIAVTIMGEMKNDPVLMETADKYMNDYMKLPVHEVNKILSRGSVQKKLQSPPPYKPKKQKKSMMSSLMNGQQ